MTAWLGPNGTMVHYYVRRGELVNWIAHFETDWREESWSVESDWREAAEAFMGSPRLREVKEHAGVAGAPEAWITTPA